VITEFLPPSALSTHFLITAVPSFPPFKENRIPLGVKGSAVVPSTYGKVKVVAAPSNVRVTVPQYETSRFEVPPKARVVEPPATGAAPE
jgi:hypothetical protein